MWAVHQASHVQPMPLSKHNSGDIYYKRQATQPGCLPSLLGNRDKRIEIVQGEEKLFCTGPTNVVKDSRQHLNSHVPAGQQAQRTNQGRTPFYLYSLSPHSNQFQQSAGATLCTILYSRETIPLEYVHMYVAHRQRNTHHLK